MEVARKIERYRFLRWGKQAFDNFTVMPPGTSIVHQVNLEYLARPDCQHGAGLRGDLRYVRSGRQDHRLPAT